MEKVRYMISDAADMVHVETHVLRYWEEELELVIPRNEMGHRYYTRENIKEFQKIKELKERGYQLKAIRSIIHTGEQPVEPFMVDTLNTKWEEPQEINGKSLAQLVDELPEETSAKTQVSALSPEERMQQFRELMSDIVGRAIAQNNEELSQTISRDVEERILKEMNYLMREQEAAQEERYRKLDAAIRGQMKKKSRFFKK